MYIQISEACFPMRVALFLPLKRLKIVSESDLLRLKMVPERDGVRKRPTETKESSETKVTKESF